MRDYAYFCCGQIGTLMHQNLLMQTICGTQKITKAEKSYNPTPYVSEYV